MQRLNGNNCSQQAVCRKSGTYSWKFIIKGVSRYVPKIKTKEMKRKKDWFNMRCITARKEKEAA